MIGIRTIMTSYDRQTIVRMLEPGKHVLIGFDSRKYGYGESTGIVISINDEVIREFIDFQDACEWMFNKEHTGPMHDVNYSVIKFLSGCSIATIRITDQPPSEGCNVVFNGMGGWIDKLENVDGS